MSSRPREADGNSGNGRRPFRAFTDFNRSTRGGGNGNGKNHQHQQTQKSGPPETTNAETYYYLKQMSSKTPMVVILTDGEEIRGWIEWYDKSCLKLNREGAPNLLIQKHCIKYLFKQDELGA